MKFGPNLWISILFAGFLIISTFYSCLKKQEDLLPRLVAEWEPHHEVSIGFRTVEMDSMFDYVSLKMIGHLAKHVNTRIIVEDSSLLPDGMELFIQNGIDTERLEVVFESPTYFWLRDPAPIFFRYENGQPGIADFRFSYYTNLDIDSLVPEDIPLDQYDKNYAAKHGMDVISSELVMEGGGFETNGQGSVILIESVVLNRNRGWTKEQVETELFSKFNVKTVIWLPTGLAEDPYYMEHLYKDFFAFGTGGHSDEFVRFVNDTTVFLAWEFSEPDTAYPLRRMNRDRMQINLQIIENTKDWRGRSFQVRKIPIPEIFYKELELDQGTYDYLIGENPELDISPGQEIKIVACAGYLNFVVTNGLVLLPGYWTCGVPEVQKEKDSLVKSIFEEYFPERNIIQINPLVLNYKGGGMHCAYFSIPGFDGFTEETH